MIDPSQYHRLSSEEAEIVRKVVVYTEKYFQDPKFDASHDFHHVLRVTALAIKILESELRKSGSLNPLTVVIGALMHDIDDKKYRSDNNASPLAQAELLRIGMEEHRARKIQTLIDGVSYSSEIKNPQRVRDLLITIPELGIVQDADRLDAIGAVGIGRCFAYGAAKTSRDLEGTMTHFDDKLVKLEGMMKTETGRRLGQEYSARLKQFQSWWKAETEFASSSP